MVEKCKQDLRFRTFLRSIIKGLSTACNWKPSHASISFFSFLMILCGSPSLVLVGGLHSPLLLIIVPFWILFWGYLFWREASLAEDDW